MVVRVLHFSASFYLSMKDTIGAKLILNAETSCFCLLLEFNKMNITHLIMHFMSLLGIIIMHVYTFCAIKTCMNYELLNLKIYVHVHA